MKQLKTAEEVLCNFIEIHSPFELYGIVDDLLVLVNDGRLKQTEGICTLRDIKPNNPFPSDIINLTFTTLPGGTIYFLSCDTYHGTGAWMKKGNER